MLCQSLHEQSEWCHHYVQVLVGNPQKGHLWNGSVKKTLLLVTKKKILCSSVLSMICFREGSDVCVHRLKQTWNTCSQSIKDLQFRIFDNPPVIDIFEAIASNLLLCWAATPIRVLDRVGVCVRMEPALLAKGVSQGDLRTIRYLWYHKIKVQISISMI